MTRLSEVLRQANVDGRSARALSRQARESGLSLNHDTAARYLRGDHGRPDEATLLALAAVLDIDLVQLRIAADLPAELTEPYVPPPEASRLNRRQRLLIDDMIRALLESSTAPSAAAESTVHELPTAARRGTAEQ